jgi:hypothetical protein
MTVRAKFRITLLVWMVSGFILLFGTVYLTEYFLVPLIVVAFVLGGYCLKLKCPYCGKPVLYNPIKVFGTELRIWTSWIPKKCTKCGKGL